MQNKKLKQDIQNLIKHIRNTHHTNREVILPYIPEGMTFEESLNEISNNATNFCVLIKGPNGSHYEGSNFKFNIKITDKYPFEPPNASCLTNIIHPNISQHHVCVETLNDGWSPTMGLIQLLMSIYAVMFTPNFH